MRRCSTHKAFTLAELLVYQAVLGFLLGSIFMVVQAGGRYLRLVDAYTSVVQQAQVGVAGLVRELSNSSRAGTEFDKVHVTFPDPNPPGSSAWTHAGADLRYYKWICYYYRPASQELVRCQYDPGAPFTIPSSSIPAFAVNMQPRPYRVVARAVESVEFAPGSASGVLEIRLTTAKETGSDRRTRVSLHTKVRIQNP